MTADRNIRYWFEYDSKGKGKVFSLQARFGTEGGYRYSSTLP